MSTASREESIFDAALTRPLEERAAFLREACGGDAALISRVEELLAAHDRSSGVLDGLCGDNTAPFRPIAEGPGTTIGHYKLLQRIGEGGFGVVFMAQQDRPVRRIVALKIIKPGMDTAEVIARFEAERQALALMEHPNIAKVLDAGATETGRPYFVMELVKGVPVTEFCDKNRLHPEARLKLFIDVCHAIQHAHYKGVIHRDIKPTNVMVTLHDGVPVVKVIDFGVAKATAHSLTEKTLFTAYGQMVGTPAYMSPEQAEMSGLDIDTRSDVYSLGVLLYELLTGTTPLENKRLRKAGYAEIQRLIREEEAPRPSTRLSSLGAAATIMAGNRGTDVKRLAQLLSGDLDWVVMKALEKDRQRRYVGPSDFAADIARYLGREPVIARPPSAIYKIKKFAQRNRAAVLTIAAFLVLFCAGTGVSVWQATVATLAKQDALERKDESDAAREAEHVARKKAELQAFQLKFDSVSAGVGEATGEHGQFLALAELLKEVPDDQPAWREHLIMSLLLHAPDWREDYLNDKRGFGVWKIAINSDRRLILTAMHDGTVQIRELPSMAVRVELHDGGMPRIELNEGLDDMGFLPGDRTVWVCGANQMRLFDASTGRSVGEPLTHPAQKVRVTIGHAASPDGTRIVTWLNRATYFGKETGHVEHNERWLWDTALGRRIAILEGRLPRTFRSVSDMKTEPVPITSFHPAGEILASAEETNVLVWSARDGGLINRVHVLDDGYIESIGFSHTGKFLAVCANPGLIWLRTADWTRIATTSVANFESVEDIHGEGLEGVAGTDDYIAIPFGGPDRWPRGFRIGAEEPLRFRPRAKSGSFVLTDAGDVIDDLSNRRVASSTGKHYSDDAKRFASKGRWLETTERLIDLDVDRQLPGGEDWDWSKQFWDREHARWMVRIDNADVFAFPADHRDVETRAIVLWAKVLARGELEENDQFRPYTEEEWEGHRSRLESLRPRGPPFESPYFDVRDRLHWLRRECETNPALFARLIAEEPTAVNYENRANVRGNSGDSVGCLSDQIEARKRSGPAFWAHTYLGRVSEVALGSARERSDYELALRWLDLRVADGIPLASTQNENTTSELFVRTLAYYRLDRFAEAYALLLPLDIENTTQRANEILVRALVRHRLGESVQARVDLAAVKVVAKSIADDQGVADGLLAEAEELIGP